MKPYDPSVPRAKLALSAAAIAAATIGALVVLPATLDSTAADVPGVAAWPATAAPVIGAAASMCAR